jgi:polyisoprenoid-binding protein YceI
LELLVKLSIKGIELDVPLKLKIIPLTENLVQIKSDLNFSRTSYQVGTGRWSSTAILKDKAAIRTNLFLFKN